MNSKSQARRPALAWRSAIRAVAAAALALLAPATALGAETPQLDGVWRSRGYGLLLDIRKGQITVYDLSDLGCFKRRDAQPVGKYLREVRLAEDGRSFVSKSHYALTDFYYNRAGKRLPKECVTDISARKSDRLWNFDLFWTYFNENYAFFRERAVDWNQVRAEYRPKAAQAATDEELLSIFEEIIAKLQDRHVSIEAGSRYLNPALTPMLKSWFEEHAKSGEKGRLDLYAKAKIRDYLRPSWNRYLDKNSVSDRSSNILVGTAKSGTIGYVLVAGESGYSDTYTLEADQAAAFRAIDEAFAAQKGKAGLIIDMRINFGGHDDVALALAGLVSDRDRPGFTKCSRHGGGFAPTQATQVVRRAAAFDGPVVVLASAQTVSAGENFLMLVKDYPNVLIVGETTASVHSDVMGKTLPNGWEIGISNEAFVAPDGTMYETVGIPPDVLVPYHPELVRSTGADPLLERAIDILSAPNFEAVSAGLKRPAGMGRPSPCGGLR